VTSRRSCPVPAPSGVCQGSLARPPGVASVGRSAGLVVQHKKTPFGEPKSAGRGNSSPVVWATAFSLTSADEKQGRSPFVSDRPTSACSDRKRSPCQTARNRERPRQSDAVVTPRPVPYWTIRRHRLPGQLAGSDRFRTSSALRPQGNLCLLFSDTLLIHGLPSPARSCRGPRPPLSQRSRTSRAFSVFPPPWTSGNRQSRLAVRTAAGDDLEYPDHLRSWRYELVMAVTKQLLRAHDIPPDGPGTVVHDGPTDE